MFGGISGLASGASLWNLAREDDVAAYLVPDLIFPHGPAEN